jgi:hypothetical protein
MDKPGLRGPSPYGTLSSRGGRTECMTSDPDPYSRTVHLPCADTARCAPRDGEYLTCGNRFYPRGFARQAVAMNSVQAAAFQSIVHPFDGSRSRQRSGFMPLFLLMSPTRRPRAVPLPSSRPGDR